MTSNSTPLTSPSGDEQSVAEPIKCPRCGRQGVITTKPDWDEVHGTGAGTGIDLYWFDIPPVLHCTCETCNQTVGLIVKGRFQNLEELLFQVEVESDTSENEIVQIQIRSKSNKIWTPVETGVDRLAQYVLSQIIYKEQDAPDENLVEFEFSLPPRTDNVRLAWVEGKAVGFYTVKPPGTLNMETMETYAMPTLDTIYIRSSYRRQGLASSALQDISAQFPLPDQNIGLSYPISLAMLQVVRKHLEENPEDRRRFWEITGCGREGNCRNLWLSLHRKPKPKPKKKIPPTPGAGAGAGGAGKLGTQLN